MDTQTNLNLSCAIIQPYCFSVSVPFGLSANFTGIGSQGLRVYRVSGFQCLGSSPLKLLKTAMYAELGHCASFCIRKSLSYGTHCMGSLVSSQCPALLVKFLDISSVLVLSAAALLV